MFNAAEKLRIVNKAEACLASGDRGAFVSGDRYATLIDPFGVRWSIMTRIEDLSPEESGARVARWAENLAKQSKA